jgi:hypothetical protein
LISATTPKETDTVVVVGATELVVALAVALLVVELDVDVKVRWWVVLVDGVNVVEGVSDVVVGNTVTVMLPSIHEP